MNILVKIINGYGDFKTNIVKARLENINKLNNLNLDKKNNELNNLDKDREIYQKKTYINYEKGLKKSKSLTMLVTFGVIGSLVMTIYGTGLVVDEFWKNKDFWVLGFILTFSQILAFYSSSITTTIKNQFNIHLKNVKLIQKMLLIVSITFNYKFLIQFINTFELQIINNIICIILCITFDVIIITFLNIIHDKKYLKYTYKEDDIFQENNNFFHMLWFVLTNKIVIKLKDKYNKDLKFYKNTFGITENLGQNIKTKAQDLGQNINTKTQDLGQTNNDLGQTNNDLGQTNKKIFEDKVIKPIIVNLNKSSLPTNEDLESIKTKMLENKDIIKSPKCNEDAPRQTNENTIQTEDKKEVRTQNKTIKKTQNKDLGHSNENIKHKTQYIGQTLKTEDLIKKVDEYIVLKYKIGDLIKVGQLKKEFNIKDRLWKDKIISNLNSAKLNVNKRLERIQIDNKDKFKIIK